MNGQAYYTFSAEARGIRKASDVARLVNAQRPLYRALLTQWLPSSREANIYEAGCGPGIFLHFLRDEGYSNLSGSDLSEPAVALARAAGFQVTNGDAIGDLGRYPAGTVDCVVAIDFIEHLSKDMLIEFLRISARTLKRGGVLILRAPNGDSPLVSRNLFNDITHYWAYTTVSMRALMTMAGFERVAFADETLAAIRRFRFVQVPVSWLCQATLRLLFRLATREDIRYWGSSLYVSARRQV